LINTGAESSISSLSDPSFGEGISTTAALHAEGAANSAKPVADSDSLNARLLIVDDEDLNVSVLRRVLSRAGYNQLLSIGDSRNVVDTFCDFAPDLVLLDLRMPHKDGFEILHDLNARMTSGCPVPVIILTADVTAEARQKALAEGAADFLTKPFDSMEVLLRVRNLLRMRSLNLQLETKVNERTRALNEAQLETLQRLAQAGEFRDDDTGQHTQRVGVVSELLASQLGFDEEHAQLIRRAAPLHDVGKIGIPDQILLKPGKLTPEEFAIMKTHTTIGAKLLGNGHSELVRLAERIAISHHERWNGQGYPQSLAEEQIPIEGRILAVVDVFDALTHARPYKEAWPVEKAVAEIERNAGTQFDPSVVQAFAQLPHEDLI
jgi:putative two-component system response regulator